MKETEKSRLSLFAVVIAGLIVIAVCVTLWHNNTARLPPSDAKVVNAQPVKPKQPDTIIRIVRAGNEDNNATNAGQTKISKKTNSSSPASPGNGGPGSINRYFNAQASGKAGISVVIIDENGVISTPVSRDIANVYSQSHQSASIGLMKPGFLKTPEFRQLLDGDASPVEKVNLVQFTDYLVLGKIVYQYRKGTLAAGTTVCNAVITMNIISAKEKQVVQSFTITNANGNGVTEQQAKDDAMQKLLNLYLTDHGKL
jgi:hypothetical protein